MHDAMRGCHHVRLVAAGQRVRVHTATVWRDSSFFDGDEREDEVQTIETRVGDIEVYTGAAGEHHCYLMRHV